MTRSQTVTLQRLRTLARHTHPGTVGVCTDWTCPTFVDAVAPAIEAWIEAPATLTVPAGAELPAGVGSAMVSIGIDAAPPPPKTKKKAKK